MGADDFHVSVEDMEQKNDKKILEQIREASARCEAGAITPERLAEIVFGLTNKGNISVPKPRKLYQTY
jgi:hypothetical protein